MGAITWGMGTSETTDVSLDLSTEADPAMDELSAHDQGGGLRSTPRKATSSSWGRLPNPIWPYDFKWSSAGIPRGYNCIQVLESADPHTWNDNFFCWKNGTKDP